MNPRDVKIGFLVKTFPKISETFILREIIALERQGVDLQIFALRRPAEDKTHAVTSQVKAKVVYVPSSFLKNPLRMSAAHLGLLLTRPWRYLRALRFVVRRQEANRFQDLLQAGYLAWFIKRSGIGHLHAHFINKPAGVAEVVHVLLALPYSITAHAKDIYLSPPLVLTRKMRHAKFVVTCNRYNRQFLRDLSGDGPAVIQIYHGVDPQQFCPEPRPKSVETLPILLSVGRLREKKGFACLLDACRLLKVGGYRFCCVIVGYGPLKDDIQRRIAELELGELVSLTGMLTQDEVIELYKRANVFVLPCQVTADGDRDGIPNVLVEALAMELAVVSTNVSGIPELVEHMRNGILVRPEDPAALAAAIAQLFDQPQLRQRLGQAGRENVCRQFSSERNVAQLKGLFLGAPMLSAHNHSDKPSAKKDAVIEQVQNKTLKNRVAF